MKNNFLYFQKRANYIINLFLIVSFLYFWNSSRLNSQETDKKNEILDVNSEESTETFEEVDALPKKAKESAEKKQSLEELLAVPFNQIKSDEEAKADLLGEKPDSQNNTVRKDGDVKLPPPPEQRKVERKEALFFLWKQAN